MGFAGEAGARSHQPPSHHAPPPPLPALHPLLASPQFRHHAVRRAQSVPLRTVPHVVRHPPLPRHRPPRRAPAAGLPQAGARSGDGSSPASMRAPLLRTSSTFCVLQSAVCSLRAPPHGAGPETLPPSCTLHPTTPAPHARWWASSPLRTCWRSCCSRILWTRQTSVRGRRGLEREMQPRVDEAVRAGARQQHGSSSCAPRHGRWTVSPHGLGPPPCARPAEPHRPRLPTPPPPV